MSTVNIITFSSLLLYVQYHEQPVCTSLLFTLLFIKSQYTVFFFFVHLIVFLHILLFFLHIFFAHLIVFCTSYCFLHILLFCTFFYFIAHFTLISPFLTICMPLCYVTLYNLYSYYFALSTERTWFDNISLLIIPCITIMWQIKKPWPWPWPHVIWICRSKFIKLELALRSIRKVSSLCPKSLQRVYPPEWERRRVEGCRGPNNCFLKCPSASLYGCAVIVQRIRTKDHGARSVHQLYPLKSFIPTGPLKWLIFNTSVWNDTSIWQPWLFFFHSEVPFGGQYIPFGTHRKNAIKFAWACVSFLPHSHVNEWKLMDWKV